MGKGKSKGPFSFRSSSIRRRPKKAAVDPPSPSSPPQQPIGAVGSPLGGGAVAKAKKKTGLARLWMRFNRSGQSELVELDRNSIIKLAAIPARDLRILGPIFSHSSNILGILQFWTFDFIAFFLFLFSVTDSCIDFGWTFVCFEFHEKWECCCILNTLNWYDSCCILMQFREI